MRKVAELEGEELDYWVARAQGESKVDASLLVMTGEHYSREWAQGGPIVERKRIGAIWVDGERPEWRAMAPDSDVIGCGPTPLIAAMRCFVASRFGDEVDDTLSGFATNLTLGETGKRV